MLTESKPTTIRGATMKDSAFKSLQSFGVLLLVLGLFLVAVAYFHSSIPDFHYGNYTFTVAVPPMWAIAGSIGGGVVLLIVGLVGAGVDKASKQEPKKGE